MNAKELQGINGGEDRTMYIGNDTFDDMSKEISRQWQEADETTKGLSSAALWEIWSVPSTDILTLFCTSLLATTV